MGARLALQPGVDARVVEAALLEHLAQQLGLRQVQAVVGDLVDVLAVRTLLVVDARCAASRRTGRARARTWSIARSGRRVGQVPADVADVEPARHVAVAVGDVEVDAGDEARAGARAEREVRAEVERRGRRG